MPKDDPPFDVEAITTKIVDLAAALSEAIRRRKPEAKEIVTELITQAIDLEAYLAGQLILGQPRKDEGDDSKGVDR